MKMLQLKDVLPYLYWFSDISILQGDTKIHPHPHDPDNWETIYHGNVMDIPWVYLNYYLTNTMDGGEAIEITFDEKKNAYFEITVCEDCKIALQYAKGEL